MKARLYLFGNGTAHRTHMSLFFVLMKSEYDRILPFPFNFNVTFCLYDQSGAEQHFIDSFRPDIESTSFQRLSPKMDIGSGIPKFLSLAQITEEGNPYVRNDTIFIKIIVDFANLPQSIIPYVANLNPGLPSGCIHDMIQEEKAKRAQKKT